VNSTVSKVSNGTWEWGISPLPFLDALTSNQGEENYHLNWDHFSPILEGEVQKTPTGFEIQPTEYLKKQILIENRGTHLIIIPNWKNC